MPALVGYWDRDAVTRFVNRDFQAAVGLPTDRVNRDFQAAVGLPTDRLIGLRLGEILSAHRRRRLRRAGAAHRGGAGRPAPGVRVGDAHHVRPAPAARHAGAGAAVRRRGRTASTARGSTSPA